MAWFLIGPNLYLCGIVALVFFSLLNFTRWTLHCARTRVSGCKLRKQEPADWVRDLLSPGMVVG